MIDNKYILWDLIFQVLTKIVTSIQVIAVIRMVGGVCTIFKVGESLSQEYKQKVDALHSLQPSSCVLYLLNWFVTPLWFLLNNTLVVELDRDLVIL